MNGNYEFLDPTRYSSLLEIFALTESEYLCALNEVVKLFPFEQSRRRYLDVSIRLVSIGHFDLLPHPNQLLSYNPVPILLFAGGGKLTHLLYLGLALRDYRRHFGRTKTVMDLTRENNYRGAIFEIEVGAELVRSGLRVTYDTTSPDFRIEDLQLGIEATARDVQPIRALVEYLVGSIASLEFGELSITITARGKDVNEELGGEVTKDVERLLASGDLALDARYGRIQLEQTQNEGSKQATITFGEHSYEVTLAFLINERLREKEDKIRKRLKGGPLLKCVIAIDTRSLLTVPIEPESQYEQDMADRHEAYYDRLRLFRREVINTCQKYVASSSYIKGVLLWERARIKTPAEEIHRRSAIVLLTADSVVAVDKDNLRDELTKLA